MGIISMINLKLVGVAMDANDLLHEAMMEMAQNDTHPLQAMWQNNLPSDVYYVSHVKGF